MLLFLRRKGTDLGAYQTSMNALFPENVNSFLPLTHLGKKKFYLGRVPWCGGGRGLLDANNHIHTHTHTHTHRERERERETFKQRAIIC